MIQELSKSAVLLCSPNIWPEDIRIFLSQEDHNIRRYYDIEKEIDELAIEDVILRVHRPENQFGENFHQIVKTLRELIDQYEFISFHCTRLTVLEQKNILNHGLTPLSPDLAKSRIVQLRKQHLVPEKTLDIVENQNNAGDDNRVGMLWFFHCQEQLQDEGGIFRLLSTWGGEALYWHHEKSKEILNHLRSIGESCIIVALLSAKDISYFQEIEDRMLEIWDNRKAAVDWLDSGTRVRRSIQVEGIIPFSNPLFEELTQSSKWITRLV